MQAPHLGVCILRHTSNCNCAVFEWDIPSVQAKRRPSPLQKGAMRAFVILALTLALAHAMTVEEFVAKKCSEHHTEQDSFDRAVLIELGDTYE